MGVNNLPRVATRQCAGRELNLQPLDYKSNALPLHYRATQRGSGRVRHQRLSSSHPHAPLQKNSHQIFTFHMDPTGQLRGVRTQNPLATPMGGTWQRNNFKITARRQKPMAKLQSHRLTHVIDCTLTFVAACL